MEAPTYTSSSNSPSGSSPDVVLLDIAIAKEFISCWQGNVSEREQAVLRGVVEGLSNKKIGGQIGVSESTIKAALQQLFKKAGVRTRGQLIRVVLENQTFTPTADGPSIA